MNRRDLTAGIASLPAHHRVRDALRMVFRVQPSAGVVDAAMLTARIVLAWIFVYYGAGKLFGAFNGPGIHSTAAYFSNTAHLHPGTFFAVLGGVIELGGGIAMAVGLCARLAGLALVGDMVMAMITVTWSTGIASTTSPPGYQVNLALAALALAVALIGAGRFSLDSAVEQRLLRLETGPAAKRPEPADARYLEPGRRHHLALLVDDPDRLDRRGRHREVHHPGAVPVTQREPPDLTARAVGEKDPAGHRPAGPCVVERHDQPIAVSRDERHLSLGARRRCEGGRSQRAVVRLVVVDGGGRQSADQGHETRSPDHQRHPHPTGHAPP